MKRADFDYWITIHWSAIKRKRDTGINRDKKIKGSKTGEPALLPAHWKKRGSDIRIIYLLCGYIGHSKYSTRLNLKSQIKGSPFISMEHYFIYSNTKNSTFTFLELCRFAKSQDWWYFQGNSRIEFSFVETSLRAKKHYANI